MSARSVIATAAVAAAWLTGALGLSEGAAAAPAGRVVQVAGTGVDLHNTLIVHSETKTPSGVLQRSTEIVELNGDLHGKVLYQVTTVIDSAKGTLVNTGSQVYSGTVAGSEPVMLYDHRFRFEVNLATGAEHGVVYLVGHLAGPRVQCRLRVTGTGKDAPGNPTFSYRGECTFAAGD